MKLEKGISKVIQSIEADFFEMDEENKSACLHMAYERPSEIMEPNVATKTPMMTDDFVEWIVSALAMAPEKSKVSIDVAFDDLDGWSEAELADVCRKNLYLRTKARARVAKKHNMLALSMCLTGIAFIILLIFLGRTLSEESALNEFLLYALDIVATVPFWCAMEIHFIDNKENRRVVFNVLKRFGAVTFRQR